MVETVIFDWDGTLHNTKALYGNAFRKACAWLKEQGYVLKQDYYSDEDAAQYIGINAKDTWKVFMPDLPEEVSETPREIIGKSMVDDIYEGKASLYPGALEVLSKLKEEGYKLAFLSNCRTSYLKAHREYFHLDRYFDRMYACEDFGWISKVEIFNTLKNELPGGYIMVGDRYTDLEVAYAHGLLSIGCAYGFGSEEELKDASAKAEDVRDIPKLVKQLSGQ